MSSKVVACCLLARPQAALMRRATMLSRATGWIFRAKPLLDVKEEFLFDEWAAGAEARCTAAARAGATSHSGSAGVLGFLHRFTMRDVWRSLPAALGVWR